MADDISKHYTSSPTYTDEDGLLKQFTFIDHDRKSSLHKHIPLTKEELEEVHSSLSSHASSLADMVLELPAVFAASGMYEECVLRDSCVHWDEQLVRNKILISPQWGRNLFLHVWRRTVPEAHWFDDDPSTIFSHKWEEWMNVY